MKDNKLYITNQEVETVKSNPGKYGMNEVGFMSET